jgi:hypothetical protein
MDVERTLFAAQDDGIREACEAMVVELTDAATTRVIRPRTVDDRVDLVAPSGWSNTPIGASDGHRFYEGAFGGCGGGEPPGDLPGALTRPGAYYKVVNGGEGIAIIVPRAKLAGFYFG